MVRAVPDLALTGVPRGGTTLACRLLGEADDTLSLFEPMPVQQLPTGAEDAISEVQTYFAQVRRKVHTDGRAPSKHHRGKVPDNPYGDGRGGHARPWLAELGEIAVSKHLSEDFHLVIKHNAAFVALLPELARRMPVLGVVRHPLAVLLSWHSVDLAVTRGRLPSGERLDPELAVKLATEPEAVQRQLTILDWCFERLLRWLPSERLLRYEDMVADGGAALLAVAGVVGVPATGLRTRNANPQYDRRLVQSLADALRHHGGPGLAMYDRATIDTLVEEILAGEA